MLVLFNSKLLIIIHFRSLHSNLPFPVFEFFNIPSKFLNYFWPLIRCGVVQDCLAVPGCTILLRHYLDQCTELLHSYILCPSASKPVSPNFTQLFVFFSALLLFLSILFGVDMMLFKPATGLLQIFNKPPS